ncbi:hypothetical protein [Metapseudomonas otitidis]|uniref:hypothetical protein n=1 Tax=Metapseudomonas otitidis TaxID=319939 RepID=UPI00366E3EE9
MGNADKEYLRRLAQEWLSAKHKGEPDGYSDAFLLFLESAAEAARIAELHLERRFFESECEVRKKNDEARAFTDEVLQNRIAELEREVAEGDAAIAVWRGRTQRAEIELEACRKDAERYRWLRDQCHRDWDVMYTDIQIYIPGEGIEDHDDLDAAIDAAMQEEAKP